MHKDEILLEQAYHTIYEDNNPFKPASDSDIKDRKQQQLRLANQKVQDYIKAGSVGDLDLYNTPIQSLPDNLKVGGGLDLRHTAIKSLPDGLEVGGNLELNNSEIQSLPRDLKVGGRLNLSFTSIESLPPGLEVGGNLDLSYTSIQSLPADLKVGGKLYLAVASLYRKYTKNEIREMCPGIDGEIYV